MAGTHGDLYCEIGELVLAANAGQVLDLMATSEELSQRYANLNVPPEAMARAIARSLGAVGVSITRLRQQAREAQQERLRWGGEGEDPAAEPGDAESPKSLFPSGVRLALLS
jgi:hypothetical protein